MRSIFKHINIAMVGEDGNAMSIMGRVHKAMRRDGCEPEEITAVMDEMKAGDYDHLLNTVMETFSVDGEGEGYFEEDTCEGCGEEYEYCDCEGDCS